MGKTILMGVLRMPPELWSDEAIDAMQRHERYVEAADKIDELEREKDILLNALQMAYRKHHCNDYSIGWNELSDVMSCALPEVMGSNEFCEWLDTVNAGEGEA